jgi:hypothetical protein
MSFLAQSSNSKFIEFGIFLQLLKSWKNECAIVIILKIENNIRSYICPQIAAQ